MKEIILLKEGEIALKGLNRGTFEDILVKNVRHRIGSLGKFEFKRAQSTIYVRPLDEEIDLDEVCQRVSKVFGISAYARAAVVSKDFALIRDKAIKYLAEGGYH